MRTLQACACLEFQFSIGDANNLLHPPARLGQRFNSLLEMPITSTSPYSLGTTAFQFSIGDATWPSWGKTCPPRGRFNSLLEMPNRSQCRKCGEERRKVSILYWRCGGGRPPGSARYGGFNSLLEMRELPPTVITSLWHGGFCFNSLLEMQVRRRPAGRAGSALSGFNSLLEMRRYLSDGANTTQEAVGFNSLLEMRNAAAAARPAAPAPSFNSLLEMLATSPEAQAQQTGAVFQFSIGDAHPRLSSVSIRDKMPVSILYMEMPKNAGTK